MNRMRREAYSIATAVVASLLSWNAAAGCLNKCSLSVGELTLEPAFDCINLVPATAQECDCGTDLLFQNNCEVDVVAEGFLFDRCGENEFDCTTVPPGSFGASSISLSKEGKKTHSFPVTIGEEEAVFQVKTDVHSFDKAGCAFGPSPARGAFLGFFLASLLIFGCARRWRSPRVS